MKNNVLAFFMIGILNLLIVPTQAKDYKISSPDGSIITSVTVGEDIAWSASVNGQILFDHNKLGLELNGKNLVTSPKVLKKKTSSVSDVVKVPVPAKTTTIKNEYNELRLLFNNDFSISFRVFNNGIAYRFETSKDGEVIVNNEQVDLNFANDFPILFPEEQSLLSHYERLYIEDKLSSFEEGKFCSLPTVVKGGDNIKIGITEADLYDYPGLFLETTGKTVLKSKFPKVILESVEKGDRGIEIKKSADYIAKTNGTRTFPWRVFMISREDKELVENQMVYLLSRSCELDDVSWIKPGLVAWDWWNDNNLHGVDFKAGINNQTYKYYIDFASKYGIPYIILDEGWSKTTTNVLEPNPEIDIPELVAYGKEKNVDIILWSLWGPIDKDMDRILDRFKEWGAKGIKVDFMAQAGQEMVNYYERVAKACAERKLLVDYHGAYKPSGLRRAYPNIVNYEGVKGLENTKWTDIITPEHDVTLPFTRMLAGPMDFTPGAMHNAHKKDFTASFSNPMSLGTRCHQIAMYAVYDAPLQMLSDSPSNYYKEKECTQFISQFKTVWDDTKVLDAKVGDYIVTARKSGSDWYIGAMTDYDARTLKIDLSFLEDGEYEIEIMQDGLNAGKAAVDYVHLKKKVNKSSELEIPMVSGGGWAAICRKL
nr:glycoside hydrolase family 97 protein [uncultured Carboxylicivirga sp.]